MSHTPGPWSYGIYSPYSQSGKGKYEIRGGARKSWGYAPLAVVRGDKRVTGGNGEQNARRIVACVNACEGLSTEQLEKLDLNPPSRGTDDELVTALTDAQMDVERMAEALRRINELISNPEFWKDPDFVSFYRGFISGACEKGLGINKDEATAGGRTWHAAIDITIPDLTPEERKAIAALKRLEKKWPDSLWLLTRPGALCVMKRNEEGLKAMFSLEGFDYRYCVETINIESDGHDW